MECISSIQYWVLLNGQPRGLIIPHRGLRQGDHLSPYLFIMCIEALIANIKKAEREKQLTGMKVARVCPSISHLLFADDSLFFLQGTKGGMPNHSQDFKRLRGSIGATHKLPKIIDSIWTQDQGI